MIPAMNRSGRGAGFASAAIFLLTVLPGDLRPAAAVDPRDKAFQEQVRPYLKQYCVACHNARARTADVALDGYTHVNSIAGDNGAWEKVLRKLRTGEMPPTGMPRPPLAATSAVLGIVGGELDRAAEAKPDPGRVAIHRLNRAEYNNAVRDLLAVDFRPADGFPADDSGYGFDNIADVLSLPPMLMEKYLSAAGRVS